VSDVHPCVECKWHVGPTGFLKLLRLPYSDKCAHPDQRMDVSGSPTPCVIVRINNCDGRQGDPVKRRAWEPAHLFEPLVPTP
jgi:hypothetical protein